MANGTGLLCLGKAGPASCVSQLADNAKRCECGSPLFLNWGLNVVAGWDYKPPTGPSPRGLDYANLWPVVVCANCDRPYGVWDGDLHDLSEIVDAEFIRSVLLRLQRAPAPAKAVAIDP